MFIGIDPGDKGGFGLVNNDGEYLACGSMDELLAFRRNVSDLSGARALIEAQAVRRSDGKARLFNLMSLYVSYGEWRGLMTALEIEFQEIQPITWKAHYGLVLQRGLGKFMTAAQLKKMKAEMALETARRLYPKAPLARLKDDGRAVGLLLARLHWQNTLYGGNHGRS